MIEADRVAAWRPLERGPAVGGLVVEALPRFVEGAYLEPYRAYRRRAEAVRPYRAVVPAVLEVQVLPVSVNKHRHMRVRVNDVKWM